MAKKVFNILVQVSIEDTDRKQIIEHLDNICDKVNKCCDYEKDSAIFGEALVDGYWNSEEDYMAGEECHDDDTWEV
jgi:hypothetical protein